MASPVLPESDARGVWRLATGAGLGLAAAILAVVLPITFLILTTYNPGGFFTYGTAMVETTTFLVLVGAILFILSLLLYRLGFSALRRVDRRFVAASTLCLIGSVGFLLIIVTAVILLGSTGSLLACVHGQPSHAITCLRSLSPLGAYTVLLGFWLSWLGGLGIVLGLGASGARYHRGSFYGGSALYTLLLLVLVGPYVDLLLRFPGAQYLLFSAPLLAILAPGLVLGGSTPLPRAVGSAPTFAPP